MTHAPTHWNDDDEETPQQFKSRLEREKVAKEAKELLLKHGREILDIVLGLFSKPVWEDDILTIMSTLGLSRSDVRDMLRSYIYANEITYTGGMYQMIGVSANNSGKNQPKYVRDLKKLVARLEANRESVRLENELIRNQAKQIMQEMRNELKL